MLLMTLGLIFYFIGVFKNDERYFRAIYGCLAFDGIFWLSTFLSFTSFHSLLQSLRG